MKKISKILAMFMVVAIMISIVPTTFAAGNMSSWFINSTAQEMQISDADENLMAYDTRINTIMILYGFYELMGEADVDLSKVEAPFTDFSNFEPYSEERKAITWLWLKGIVKGYEDNTVRASNQISRSEFISLLVRILENMNSGLRVNTGINNPYDDIDGHWAYTDIIKATNLGIVQGDGKSFMPNNWISKEEVISIGQRLADKMEIDINDYADIVDNVYEITIDYPIYTNGNGRYDYSQYDYVINVDDYQNIYFHNISSISSYNTSKTGIVSISKYSGYLKVTGKQEGVITITAKSSSGYQSSVKVLVVDEYGNNKDSYTVRLNGTQKVYHPDRNNIKSYTVTSGSSYISVTKYSNYLSVRGIKVGTAKIKIVDNYGSTDTVTVKVTSSSSSSYYDDYYEIEVGDYENVYAPTGENIKSYSISSGSNYITVSKYSGYLKVSGRKEGTAKIKITDTYGYTDTITIDVIDDYRYSSGYDYGFTEEYQIDAGDYENIYFSYIDYIDEYKLSKTGIVSVTQNSRYLKVYAKSGGSVTITVYDDYGNSERIRVHVDDDYYYDDDSYDYGITDTISINNDEETKIYFYNLDGDLEDYDVSKSGIIDVTMRSSYIIVEGRNGKSGTVTLTAYDEYGSSESVKIKVYDTDDYDDDGSEPPYRDVIYPPGYEVDISQ